MRFSPHKAVTAGLIAALCLTASPVWANSLTPDTRARSGYLEQLNFLEKEFTNFGRASWYGTSAHGRRTASGRVFDRDTFTAAHPTLPFGTVLRVHNLANERQVLVTVTDRGPFSKTRVLDLSPRAAQRLRMTTAGVISVSMEVVGDPEGRPLNEKSSFYLCLDRVATAADAHRESAEYKAKLKRDIRVLITEGVRKEFQICIGPFADFASAEETLDDIGDTVPVTEIIEGPTMGGSVPLHMPPPKMAVGPGGKVRNGLSEK